LIDYEKFTENERDNFVKNTLDEKELRAAISAATNGGRLSREPLELLAFCFKVATKKMDRLHKKIAFKRARA